MKRKCSELKQMARASLSGRFKEAVLIIIIYMLISYGMNGIATFITGGTSEVPVLNTMNDYIRYLLPVLGVNIIISILLQVFVCGLYKFFLNFVRNEEYKVSDLFYGFTHNPDRIIVANIAQFVIFFIIMIPVIMAIVLSSVNSTFLLVAIIMFVFNLAIIIMLSYRWQLYSFLLMDNPEMGGLESMRVSGQLTNGHKGRMLYIALSFIGWQILAMCTLGIGQLWLLPYSTITIIFFYMERTGELDSPEPEYEDGIHVEMPEYEADYTNNDIYGE